jgi:hypothetical protein
VSKFKDILKAAKEREEDKSEKADNSPSQHPKSQIPSGMRPNNSELKKRGRPKGKRSNPDYEQVTAYIRKETYRQSKIALLQQEEEQDFSELIEKLLTEWLSTQKSKNSDI